MVGCMQSPTTEEAAVPVNRDAIKKPPSPNDPVHLRFPEVEDFSSSFSDTFLDFDSINCCFSEGESCLHFDDRMDDLGVKPDEFGFGKIESVYALESIEGCANETFKKNIVEEGCVRVEDVRCFGQEEGDIGTVELNAEFTKEESIDNNHLRNNELCKNLGDFECSIDKHLEKARLDAVSDTSLLANSSENGDTVIGQVHDIDAGIADSAVGSNVGHTVYSCIGDIMNVTKSIMTVTVPGATTDEESESKSGSKSEISPSSSSTSSSDAEEELDKDSSLSVDGYTSNYKKGVFNEGVDDLEEGEFLSHASAETVAWSDNEDDDGGNGVEGPITSKNELHVLPPVPPVTVTLQPHHQTHPVGKILSIVGPQVIVEGIEKHDPLNEGSVLWITGSRSPLGMVDEIFGPVRNPYYVVRYNSESEVPDKIQLGVSISFVSEFANHVLNEKNLYQKGYDASDDNDEELTDELYFSDDEKEAEHKKMSKMKKRGTNESMPGTKSKDKRQLKNPAGNWKCHQFSAARPPSSSDKQLFMEEKFANRPVQQSLNKENNLSLSGVGLNFSCNPVVSPPFPVRTPRPGFVASSGVWSSIFPVQQPHTIGFSGDMLTNCTPWMQQNQPYQFLQAPLQTGVIFQQPNTSIPGWPFNLRPLINQSNFSGAPAFGPLPGFLDQSVFNQSQVGRGDAHALHTSPPLNVKEPAHSTDQISNSSGLSPMNSMSSQIFNVAHGGGRRGCCRGRRHGGGGRGSPQNHQFS